MRLVPGFTLQTNNQTNNECFPKFVQTHNASSSIRTAIVEVRSLEIRCVCLLEITFQELKKSAFHSVFTSAERVMEK